jgi:drug/metabolite transporter (DMT)-like permease
MKNRNILGYLYLMGASMMWGGMFVISKYILNYIPPFTLLWIRYLIAVLILGGVLVYRKSMRIQWSDLPFMIWLGFIGYVVSIGGALVGTKLSNAHMASIMTSSAPAFTYVLGIWILKEKFNLKNFGLVMVATLGMVIASGNGPTGNAEYLKGNLVLTIAAISWALFSVQVKKLSASYSTLAITSYSMVSALLLTTPMMVWESGMETLVYLRDPLIFGGTMYVAIIATALAFYLWNHGLELVNTGTGSLFYFFAPLVATILGWLMLDEKLTWNFVVGWLIMVKKPESEVAKTVRKI